MGLRRLSAAVAILVLTVAGTAVAGIPSSRVLAAANTLSCDNARPADAPPGWGPETPPVTYDGEPVCANGTWKYVDGPSSGYGTEWQCVELVQRFFADRWGIRPGPNHSPIWPGVSSASQMFSAVPPGVVAYKNGDTKHPPVPGDALVFASWGVLRAGHVAIVSAVSPTQITFVQQNVSGRPQDFLPVNGTATIADTVSIQHGYPPVLGWLHATKNQGAAPPIAAVPTPDLGGPQPAEPSAQLASPTPTPTPAPTATPAPTPTTLPTPTPTPPPIIPGGLWISPANGATVAGPVLQLAAHAYPSHPGDPAIDHVNFTVWWPALGLKSGPWKLACPPVAPPSSGDTFACDANLATLGTPTGTLSVSFDVYDRVGNKNLSPNGEHVLDYQPAPPPTPVPVPTPTPRPAPTPTPAALAITIAVDRASVPVNGVIIITVRTNRVIDQAQDEVGVIGPSGQLPNLAVGGGSCYATEYINPGSPCTFQVTDTAPEAGNVAVAATDHSGAYAAISNQITLQWGP